MSHSAVGSKESEGTTRHAHRHVAKFLKIPQTSTEGEDPRIQILHDGQQLTADRLLENQSLNIRRPILVKDSPQSIGMKLPVKKGNEKVTVRDIAHLLGNHHRVHVIIVEHDEEEWGWKVGDLVDYFEDETRLMQLRRFVEYPVEAKAGSVEGRREAAGKCIQMTRQKNNFVLNQIYLEFSKTKVMEEVLSPRFVREMDWIDIAWPRRKKPDGSLERSADEIYPNVQNYCITSGAGCYTDFHVAHGGTSVWYHVLNGEQDFCLIPPTKENWAIYQHWLCRQDQYGIFLPDMVPKNNMVRVSLKESQTLIIPTAWIHCVYTPKDSLVFRGNFLHGADIPLQIAVHRFETRTEHLQKLLFPHFVPMNFYAGGFYLDKLRRGAISKVEVEGLEVLIDALEEWWKEHKHSKPCLETGLAIFDERRQAKRLLASAATESARRNHCDTVEAFLEALRHEHRRVTNDGISPNAATLIRSDPMKVPSAPIEGFSSSGKPKLPISIKKELRSASPYPTPALSDDALRSESPYPTPALSDNALRSESPYPTPALSDDALRSESPYPTPALSDNGLRSESPHPTPALSDDALRSESPYPTPALSDNALQSGSPHPTPALSDDALNIPSVGAVKRKSATSAPNEELKHVHIDRNMTPKTITDLRIVGSSPGCTRTLPSKQKRPREHKEWIDDCAP